MIEEFRDSEAKDDSLRNVKLRILFSALCAAPLAVVSLAIGDFVGLPDVVRYAVSPGFVLGLDLPASGSFVGDVSRVLRIAIAANEVYYAILIFLAFSFWNRRRKRPSHPAEGEVMQRQGQT